MRSISDEMVTLVVSATLLWVRWALTRLAHVLLQAPENLIRELRGSVTRRGLQRHLAALDLPDQPEDVQHALGVAFGQRAASGTFVAREVGIDGPANSDDLVAWPATYRLGAAEGLTLSQGGYVTLTSGWVATVVDMLAVLSPSQVKKFAVDLAEKLSESGVAPHLSVPDLYELARTIRSEAARLPEAARDAWMKLAEIIDPLTEDEA
jgi:hypothetical protein